MIYTKEKALHIRTFSQVRETVLIMLILIIFSAIQVFGQNKLELKGQVRDASTGESLPYATIALQSKSIGTISNNEGFFVLPVSAAMETDSIIISFVGYASIRTTISACRSTNEFHLKPETKVLEEVVVTSEKFKAKVFVIDAIEKYNSTKRQESHLAVAHYWETASKDSKYIMFNESIGYTIYAGDIGDAVPLSNYNFFPENTRCDIENPEWLNCAANNPGISHSRVPPAGSSNLNLYRMFELRGILSNKFCKKYRYRLDSTYYIGNSLVYVVGFNGNDDSGKIHIFAHNKHLLELECNTNKLWSTAFHERVDARTQLRFNYFEDAPFMSEIASKYERDGLEHSIFLEVLVQKFFGFELNRDEYWSLNSYGHNPYLSYSPQNWQYYTVSQVPDFEKIEADLKHEDMNLEQYFISTSEHWFSDENQRPLAIEFIQNLKKYF